MEGTNQPESPSALRAELEAFAARERRKLGNVGEVLLEWSFEQLKAAGSIERLLKYRIRPSAVVPTVKSFLCMDVGRPVEMTESFERPMGYTRKITDSCKFEVDCSAGKAGALQVGAASLAVQVGQRIRKDGAEQIWYSVSVYANEEENGDLVIRVLISNPDWDEPLQIVRITSRPRDASCKTSLGCNLDHKTG